MSRIVSTVSISALMALALLAIAPHHLGAQSTPPATGCVNGVTVEPLARGLPSSAEGKALSLLRVTFAPGGSIIGLHAHPGSLVLSIESRVLGYTIQEGEVKIQRAATDGTPGAVEPLTPGEEVLLNPGDALFEEGVIHSARNTGDVPTVVLVAGLMAADEAFTQCVEDA